MIRKILICGLIVAFLIPTTFSRAKAALHLTVNAPTDVYNGTDDSSSIIGQALPGESYAITGRSELNFYYQIDFKGQVGWVLADAESVNCPYAQHIADGCPDIEIISVVDYQLFEHGMMLWFKDTQAIHVLYGNTSLSWGGLYNYLPDEWTGEVLPKLTPPPGLLQPQMGFGTAWLKFETVRKSLGWATAPEGTYVTPVEYYLRTPAGSRKFFRLPPNVQFFNLPAGQAVMVSNYETMWAIVGHDM